MGTQAFDDFSPQALALELGGHHHIPQHGPEDAIAAGSAETHQLLPLPGAHGRSAALEHAVEVGAAAPRGPEAVLIKQGLQLPQRPRRSQPWAKPQPQPWCPPPMADQQNRTGTMHAPIFASNRNGVSRTLALACF